MDHDEERPDAAETEAETTEEFLRRPSTLPDIGIDLSGFATEELARSVGEVVNGWLHAFGKFLNLKRLMRVIVAFNYEETLAGLDRGTMVARSLTATNDEIAVGIAMAPTVLHEGEPRSVMVLNAAYMSVFASDESPEIAAAREYMIYALAHECGHVHDLEIRASSMPDTILKAELGYRDGILFGIASGCWDEYIACRLSAFMGKEPTLRAYEDTFCSALEAAKARADAAIRLYRMHADIGRVMDAVAGEYRRAMVYASYLLGHLDGLDADVEARAPKTISALEDHIYFKPFFLKLHAELRSLHSTYGNWKSLDVYEPLKQLVYELLKLGGIDIQNRPGGKAYVDVRRRLETMPTLKEQVAFLKTRNAGIQD